MPEVHPNHSVDPHFSALPGLRLTLEPLRQLGPDALSIHDLQGIGKITFRAVEIAWGNALHTITICKSDDLFESAGAVLPLPCVGTLVGASFDLHFQEMDRPIMVHIRPPFTLLIEPACDTRLLFSWLDKRGFTVLPALAKALALAALVLTTALSPVLDPDPDVDEDEHPHHQWSLTAR